MIERANATIKEIIQKSLELDENFDWIKNLQKIEIRGFKYLLNAIDMSSRYFYSQALKNKTDTEVLKSFIKNIKPIKNQSDTFRQLKRMYT